MRRRVIDLAAVAHARAALAATVREFPELTAPAAQSRALAWLATPPVDDPTEVPSMPTTINRRAPKHPKRPLLIQMSDSMRAELRAEAARRAAEGEVNASMASLIRELLAAGLREINAPTALRAAARRGR